MKAYINIVIKLIENQYGNEIDFSLIKLESFNSPKVYLEVCEFLKNKYADNFVGKLSRQKYFVWRNINLFEEDLDKLTKSGFVEINENLTKWRNDSFIENSQRWILLMGTEEVEDKGGLEEFYTISPATIESYVGDEYSKLLKALGVNLKDDEEIIFNTIYKTLFKFVQKDLALLSEFLEKHYNEDFLVLISNVYSSLYEYWNMPNICNNGSLKQKQIKDIFEKSYKFSRRINIEKYQQDKNLNQINKKVDEYYKKYKKDIDAEWHIRFSTYNNLDEFKVDLTNYIKGINILSSKEKLFRCDFLALDKILNLKVDKIDPKKAIPVLTGDPFKAISLPILDGINEIKDGKFSIRKIEIEIKSIRLSNTRISDDNNVNNEELANKWLTMCYFLGGIESLIIDLNLSTRDGELFEISLISKINDKNNVKTIYPFRHESIKELIDSGILKSTPNSETKSKIDMEYRFFDDNGEVKEFEYRWNILDSEPWMKAFDYLSSNDFTVVTQCESTVPIAVSEDVDLLINTITYENFIDKLKTSAFMYKNICNNLVKPTSVLYDYVFSLGKYFNDFIREIKNKGFFNSIKNSNVLIDFLSYYQKFLKETRKLIMDNKVTDNEEQLIIKAFMILNNPNLYSDSIIGAIIPPYHPIMLEKIVERYVYLTNGFLEIYNQITETEGRIRQDHYCARFDRFDQLSTITSPVDALVGKNDKLISYDKTYGFYSIFGESDNDYFDSELNYDESEEETDDIKLTTNKTPISMYISKVISEYIKTYPAKVDGVVVAFYEPKDYKEIIYGVQNSIKILSKSGKLKIKIIVYTRDYKCKGSRYLKYWVENNFTEDDNVDIEISTIYLDLSNGRVENLQDRLKRSLYKSDIVFISDIMSPCQLKPEEDDSFLVEEKVNIENRYPMVYLPITASEATERKMIISQPQFACSNLYTQLIVNCNDKIAKDSGFKLVQTVTLEDSMKEIFNIFHNFNTWVVVLDKNVDTEILNFDQNKIIAFSTGKGYYGELNTAISSKENYVDDLQRFLSTRLKRKFEGWSTEESSRAASFCIESARYLDGAELLKAINPADEAVNNYLAYILVNEIKKISKSDDNYYLKKLISLDSYSHLFDEEFDLEDYKEVKKRPDFLLLEVLKSENDLQDGYPINIRLSLIECKLAKENDMHVQKAKDQLKSGFKRITKIWDRSSESVQSRFWFNQLYRILSFNNKNIPKSIINELNKKLYGINEGRFHIDISNILYTFWIDVESARPYDADTICDDDIEINHISVYAKCIKDILLNNLVDFDRANNGDIPIFIDNDDNIDNFTDFIMKPLEEIAAVGTKEESDKYDAEDDGKDNQELEDRLKGAEDCTGIISNSIIEKFKSIENESIENEEEIIDHKLKVLKNELEYRNIKVFIKNYVKGPDIVRASIELGTGVNLASIDKHKTDMQLWLQLNDKPLMFIEDGYLKLDMVREKRQTVYMKDLLQYINANPNVISNYKNRMIALMGSDIVGSPMIIDFSDSNTPHLLIAGQTGSGKSVLLAAILTSIMCLYTPEEVEMILIDPKRVELTAFRESPFTKKVAVTLDDTLTILDSLKTEMDRRYDLFMNEKVQNIADYNLKIQDKDKRLKRTILVIDEYGQLIEDNKEAVKKFESYIKSLSQLARAAGIHLIICTQTPRADIITTPIRNNLTARVALRVADANASGLILDGSGAESLLGKGDLLLRTGETSTFKRGKSMFVSQGEIEALIDILKE